MASSKQYSEKDDLDVSERPSTQDIQVNTISAPPPITEIPETELTAPTLQDRNGSKSASWLQWYEAFKQIWPIYLATHIAFFILTYLANLFLIDNFSGNTLGLRTLLTSWDRWDTGQFKGIATQGYAGAWQTAFFPLYPVMEKGLAFLTRDPLIAGLIIANAAAIVAFTVLYRLVAEIFDQKIAIRTVLYLAIFPTSFFLVAAYNESLFICLNLLSFYYMRQGKWWLAGVFGLLATLTRSSGIFLFIPFCYEYLRQHDFRLKNIRISAISSLLIPLGIVLFAIYCYLQFHDFLAFSHAQAAWGRELQPPWMTFIEALRIIRHHKVLSFDSIHTVIDLSAGIVMPCLLILGFVGPWKFSRDHWSYLLYGAALYLFLIMFPAPHYPVQSLSRLVIELFPAFIVLAILGKKPTFNLYYITIAGSVLCFLLLQYLTGRWIV